MNIFVSFTTRRFFSISRLVSRVDITGTRTTIMKHRLIGKFKDETKIYAGGQLEVKNILVRVMVSGIEGNKQNIQIPTAMAFKTKALGTRSGKIIHKYRSTVVKAI